MKYSHVFDVLVESVYSVLSSENSKISIEITSVLITKVIYLIFSSLFCSYYLLSDDDDDDVDNIDNDVDDGYSNHDALKFATYVESNLQSRNYHSMNKHHLINSE